MKTTVKFNHDLRTSGTGLWTLRKKHVSLTKLQLSVDEEFECVELRVYFDGRKWPVKKWSVIYTDPRFLRELKGHLKSMGLDVRGVDYNKYGMQGTNFVSLDVTSRFIKSWQKLDFKKV